MQRLGLEHGEDGRRVCNRDACCLPFCALLGAPVLGDAFRGVIYNHNSEACKGHTKSAVPFTHHAGMHGIFTYLGEPHPWQ